MKKLILFLAVFMLAAMIVSANPIMPTLADETVNETQTAIVTIDLISGPDNGSTTWTADLADFSLLTSNDTHAEFVWATDYSDAGVYTVIFTAEDLDSTDSETITVTINNVNRLPTISSTPVTTAVQNHAYSYDVEASDLDGETLTYLLSVAPAGMTIDSTTGVISWTPTAVGSNDVTVQVSDGTDIVEQAYTIVVSAPTKSMSISDIILGGSSQERDEIITTTFTVSNTGTEDIADITFASTADVDYLLAVVPETFSLVSGASQDVTLQAYVPLDQDADQNKIGILTATGTSGTDSVTAMQDVYMEAENNLEIKDVNVIINDDSENVDDGDSVDVFPASEVKMEIEVKNTFGDLNIEDIVITVINDDLDIDEEEEISKLKDGDRETVTISFDLDDDADEDKYDVDIRVEGEDEEGAMHYEEWTITFNLEEDGIIITGIDLMPETLVCGRDSVDLKLELTNVGTRDEDEVVVEIVADSIDFEKRVAFLEIQEKDDISRTYQIEIPSDASPGTHVIQVQAFKDVDTLTHTKYIYLNIPAGCSDVVDNQDDDTQQQDDNNIVVDNGSDLDDVEFIDVGTGSANNQSSSLFSSTWGTVLLILANLLILLIIVILIVRFLF